MHFTLAYDIIETGSRRTSAENQISSIIGQYSWVKVLNTTYVIRVNGQLEWNEIASRMQNVAQTMRIYFIMTPLMQGGHYDGWLPDGTWSAVNDRTN